MQPLHSLTSTIQFARQANWCEMSTKGIGMFSLFRRNKKSTYPEKSSWSVLEGEQEGNPMVVRRNDSAAQLRGHAEYIHRMGIAVPLLNPDANGFPSSQEMNALDGIEDLLVGKLEAHRASLLVLVITTSAMREFIFYTKSPGQIEAAITKARQEFAEYEFDFYVEPDAEWDSYNDFAESS